MLNEEHIISKLQKAFPSKNGIGDDAAIINISANESILISKDLLVENIHFRLKYYTPKELAYKTLYVNFSDIYAMGGRPSSMLLGIGGDTTSSDGKFFISITVMGEIENDCIKLRSSAKDGDIIYILGNPGYANIGLQLLENDESEYGEEFKARNKKPKIFAKEALWLSAQNCVHSMMDLSDGLAVDLAKLCKASGVSALVNIDNFIYSAEYIEACRFLSFDETVNYLSGGEDYALLFTLSKDSYKDFLNKFNNQFGYCPTMLGYIKPAEKNLISYIKNGNNIYPKLKGFSHFGELV
jgi:thiamine-monophosphate kinase